MPEFKAKVAPEALKGEHSVAAVASRFGAHLLPTIVCLANTEMRRIDEQILQTPFFGVRQMSWHLRNEGHLVNEKRIRRPMRLMGLMPIYRKPNTSKAAKGHKTYPYLLRGLRVARPNQVWAADITDLPM